MPFRQRGSYGKPRQRLGNIVDSNKNVVSFFDAFTTGVNNIRDIAEAQDSATLAVADDVERGCIIKAIWMELWIWSTTIVADGVTSGFDAYIMKNPGNNLTPPLPGTTGTSNEKKFIFKTWKGLTSTRSQGAPPYSWKGWIKIPKRYQRMGANDKILLNFTATGANALACQNYIYKWYK